MTRQLTLLFLIINVNVLFSQQTLSDTYTPSDNGYIMTVPFEFEFINCIGSDRIPHLSVSKNSRNTTSNKYKYNGEIYTESELGSGSFSNMKKYIGYTDVKVDIYDGNSLLGTVKLANVTGYGIGCQGQLYDVFKKLGINGKAYKDRINALSIFKLRIIKISNSDAGLEIKIRDYNKTKKIESLLSDLNYSFSATRYDEAEEICNEIKKIEYSNIQANEILEEIKKIRKNEKKEEEYEQYISKGDIYFDEKDFINAKKEYENALNTNVGNEKAQNKIWTVERAEKADVNENTEKDRKLKKEEANSLAIIKSTKKEPTEFDKMKEDDRQKKIEQKIKEDTDYYQGRRDTKKALEEERKIKIKENQDKLTKSIGEGFGSIINSWANGDSYLRFAYGIRELQGEYKHNERTSVNFSTIEAGYGFGKLGVFLGGGLPPAKLSSPTEDARGFTAFGGLEYTIYKHRKGYAIGINTEIGFGKLKRIYSGSSNGVNTTTDYPSTYYSLGAQVTLFKFLYVSYNYGLHSPKSSTRSYSDGRPDQEFVSNSKGEFSKIAVGLIFDFDY